MQVTFPAALLDPGIPGLRLTTHATEPVAIATVAATSTLRYLPYTSDRIRLWDGVSWREYDLGSAGITNDLTQTTVASAGPAAAANNSVYDVFAWPVGVTTTVRLTRGPLWTNDTTRSAGTALVRVDGVLMNNAAITNGPAASRGRYVGTFRTNGAATIDWIIPSANGVAAFFGLWNNHNRVRFGARAGDNTSSWSYTTATWRPQNNTALARCSWIAGLAEDVVDLQYNLATIATANVNFGIGIDQTTAAPTHQGYINNSGVVECSSVRELPCALGFHFGQGLELGNAGTTTWFGQPYTQLSASLMA